MPDHAFQNSAKLPGWSKVGDKFCCTRDAAQKKVTCDRDVEKQTYTVQDAGAHVDLQSGQMRVYLQGECPNASNVFKTSSASVVSNAHALAVPPVPTGTVCTCDAFMRLQHLKGQQCAQY